MSPFDRAHTTSYSTLMETMHLSCIIFTALHYASTVLTVVVCPSARLPIFAVCCIVLLHL